MKRKIYIVVEDTTDVILLGKETLVIAETMSEAIEKLEMYALKHPESRCRINKIIRRNSDNK